MPKLERGGPWVRCVSSVDCRGDNPHQKHSCGYRPIFESPSVTLVGAPGGSEHSVVTAMEVSTNDPDRFSIFGNTGENQLYHLYLGPTEIQSRSALYQLRYPRQIMPGLSIPQPKG